MQRFERVMNQYNFDDLKKLQFWTQSMTKGTTFVDNEQMQVLFGVDMKELQGQCKTKEAITAKDFFEACY